MSNRLLIGADARAKILTGARKIAEAVKLTLGPRGRNVLVERPNADPLITNDGVTIAREIELECPYEAIGAHVLREASIKTNTQAGDGTTTSILLAQQILELASKKISFGESPVLIKEGLFEAADVVVAEVSKAALPIERSGQRRAIAINSCANVADGIMVADAVSRIGANGIVTVEENKSGTTALTFVDGLELNLELASPYFCEDASTLSTIFKDAKVFITDKRINSIKEVLTVLEDCAREKAQLVIIADDYAPEVVSALVVNKVRAGLRVCALRCGFFANQRDALLGDLAALTSGEILADFSENPIKLGTCDKVIMSLESSKFISHKTDALANRVQLIKAQLDATNDEYNKARLGERLARLTNGVAVISVGCATEVEQKEKRLRVEDALAATRAACEEGIVAGGGLALLHTKTALAKYIKSMPKLKRVGAEILLEVLDTPFRQICANSEVNADLILPKVRRGGNGCIADINADLSFQKINPIFGYDALNRKFVDMSAAGIVDPAKVVKCALRNAVSVAGTLLTTEGIVLK